MAGAITFAYRTVDDGYFARRGLKRHARAWSIWAFAVGIVITGEFSGWNFGLTAGGFGGLLVATILASVMYVCLCHSLAELSSAMPFAGGAYGFARTALGPLGGFAAGFAQVIEYVLAAAVVCVAIGSLVHDAVKVGLGLEIPHPLIWLGFYVLFVALNVHSARLTFTIMIFASVVALAVLLVFWIGAASKFDLALALDIPAGEGGSAWLPNGVIGVAWAMPFAIWFYLAIEAVPLAAEETEDPVHALPRGMMWGMATLIAAAFLTLILNSGVSPGAREVGASEYPLLLAFAGVFGADSPAAVLLVVGLAGLVSSFHATIYAYGRSIFALARAGYLPPSLALTHGARRTPHMALIAGAGAGLAVALVIHYAPRHVGVDTVLLNMSVFAAIISYILQMLSYLVLRRDLPAMERPHRSALGGTGAMTTLVIAIAALLLLFANPAYRYGLLGCIVLIGVALLYFMVVARQRLVPSPEEAFALAQRAGARSSSAPWSR
ncbi:MAG: amino acid permease [Pseudomonadota bacterium]